MSPSTESLFRSSILNMRQPIHNLTDCHTDGWADGLIILLLAAFFLCLRQAAMQIIFLPLSLHIGLKSPAKRIRFSEQAYTGLYAGFAGVFGLWIMYRSPLWYFQTRQFYEDYPHQSLTTMFKFYYLLQAGYWLHQVIVLVLGIEKPRSDIRELTAHHVVTFLLIVLSYRFHFTQIGLAVFISHDIPEFFLAASKILHYIDSLLMGPWFGLMILNWVYMRHYLNWHILWSVMTEFQTVGPYELDWANGQFKCWISNAICFVLLLFLQILNLYWLNLLLRVARRYIKSGVAVDDRSDAEDHEMKGK